MAGMATVSDHLRAAIRDGQLISAAKRRTRAARRPVLEGNSLHCEAVPGGHFICGAKEEQP